MCIRDSIDTHSHLGVYAAPGVKATADGNEMTDPTTPYVFSEHSFWPQDPQIERAVAGSRSKPNRAA